jgi:CRP-like cAMP-binding protein
VAAPRWSLVHTGDAIHDMPMLPGKPQPFDAVARRDTEMIALSRQRFSQLLRFSPTLAVRWMTSIAPRLDHDRRRLVVIMSKPLIAQIAYLLLDVAALANSGQCIVRLSHATMATLLGVRRQSVTRDGRATPTGPMITQYGITWWRTKTACTSSWGT